MAETNTLIKTTCPRDCYDVCGMLGRVATPCLMLHIAAGF